MNCSGLLGSQPVMVTVNAVSVLTAGLCVELPSATEAPSEVGATIVGVPTK